MDSNRVLQFSQIGDAMRERRLKSKRDELAVVESVVSLPAIMSARGGAAHTTPAAMSAADQAALTARPRMPAIAQPWKAPQRANPGSASASNITTAVAPSTAVGSVTCSLNDRLQNSGPRSVPPTVVPPKYFIYKTTFDLDSPDEAHVAQYDFTASEANHLTYKIPVFPSVSQVTSDGTVKAVVKPAKTLRPEVRYIAQVADHMYASVGTMVKNDPFTDAATNDLLYGASRDETFGAACVAVKKTLFILNESARLITPLCYELGELLMAVRSELERVPRDLATSRKHLVDAGKASETKLELQAATIAAVTAQVQVLRTELEAVRAAQVSESQRYVQQVTAMGLTPGAPVDTSRQPARPTFSVEQINYLSTSSSNAYAFSPERVVAGKRFVKHPPVMRDVAVDCTDLYFDGSLKAAATPFELAPPKRLEFRGKSFVQAVQRVLDTNETAEVLRKRGLQLSEVPIEVEAPFETSPTIALDRENSEAHLQVSNSFGKRRASVNFKKKVSLLTKASKLMFSAGGQSDDNSGAAGAAVGATATPTLSATADVAESPTKVGVKRVGLLKAASVAVLAAQQSHANNSPPGLSAATSFRKMGQSFDRADALVQTDQSYLSTSYADSNIQVVEADIARKLRNKPGAAGASAQGRQPSSSTGHIRSESLNVTPRPPGSARGSMRSESRAQELPLSAAAAAAVAAAAAAAMSAGVGQSGDAGSELGPVLIEAPLWRAAFTEGLGEPMRSPLMPFEAITVGVNTDVSLTGFDVTSLSFIDAVKLRFMPTPADADNDHFDGEASMSHTQTEHRTVGAGGGRHHHGKQAVTPRAGAGSISGASGQKSSAAASAAPELPEAISSIFGLKTTDNFRPHTVAWLNALALELVKHVDPFKMVQQNKPLPVWAFAHFRAKYGLGKMATTYCLDFLGNLKLHHLGSIRAHLLISWLGLREYAGLTGPAPFITAESLYLYVISVLNIARSGTHKTLKDFDTAELLLPPQRIEAVCDAALRNVASSMEDADEWAAARTGWHNVLLNTASLPTNLRRLCDEIQAARGKPGSLDLLAKSPDETTPFPRNVSIDADVLLLLFVVNYNTLRERLIARATLMRTQAAAASSTQVGFNDAGEFVESVIPPVSMIVASLASWPIDYVALEPDASTRPASSVAGEP